MTQLQKLRKILIGKSIRSPICRIWVGFITDVILSDDITSVGCSFIIIYNARNGNEHMIYARTFSNIYEYHDGDKWSSLSDEYYYGIPFSGTARYFTFTYDEV